MAVMATNGTSNGNGALTARKLHFLAISVQVSLLGEAHQAASGLTPGWVLTRVLPVMPSCHLYAFTVIQ